MFSKSVQILTVLACSFFGQVFSQHGSQDLEVFLALPFTIEDEIATREILAYIINKDIDELLENQNVISRARERLETIPSIRLLAFILSDPDLSHAIKAIDKTDIRLHFLVAWFDILLKNVKEPDLFDQQLSGFSDFLHLDKEIIQNYAHQKDFRGLVKHLLYTSL